MQLNEINPTMKGQENIQCPAKVITPLELFIFCCIATNFSSFYSDFIGIMNTK